MNLLAKGMMLKTWDALRQNGCQLDMLPRQWEAGQLLDRYEVSQHGQVIGRGWGKSTQRAMTMAIQDTLAYLQLQAVCLPAPEDTRDTP